MPARSRQHALDPEEDDEALLRRFASGDRLAARDLSGRMAPLAYRVALRMLGDAAEAEDVAQDAMIRLWRHAGDWRDEGARVSTWLYRVVSNLAIDRIRRRRTVPLDAAPEPSDPAPGPEERLTETARARALEAALMDLPERQRQAVVLRHLEGLGNPEIAEIMEVGVEAVESLIARGKRTLAAALAGRREELGYGDA
ncbi:MAG: RNA polymerase sigma factor [Defluviimonas sp.]|uniref:RNA polymerase sigma factor n=1 Tax=Albidovulum sp. TaxID=1872424 RepID=UPI001D34D3E8|nr:RNA polymerase sigma factor [Paracoccaceae bacterium]MCC0063569.1 RNA polymerase sigma factor [Defluviimonas sp.]